jgi:hypothetical protein
VDISTGEEFSFFAPHEDVHAELSKYNAGDNVTLLKTASQKGRKVITEYTVTPANGGPLKSTIHDAPVNGNATPPAPTNGNGAAPTNGSTDRYFDLLLGSYRDALKIQKELGGLCDVNKISITLFIARSKTNGHSIAASTLT